ncbi:MAG: hypothetical protein J7L26_04735 [Candidatus Aminicenantes bacterium]|nr:hypothetical protein [Candidatus Aminicenantes bacterium]
MTEFEERTTEALATLSAQYTQIAKEIRAIHGKIERIFDPETGIYKQHNDLAKEVKTLKKSFGVVIGAALFVGAFIRDIGVRIFTKLTN